MTLPRQKQLLKKGDKGNTFLSFFSVLPFLIFKELFIHYIDKELLTQLFVLLI